MESGTCPTKTMFCFFALVHDGEVGVARDIRLDLDEVNAAALEHVHGAAAILGSGDRDGALIGRFWAVEHWPGNDHVRAEQPLLLDIFARLEDRVEIAAHIANAGDAVGDEERQGDVSSRFRAVVKKCVDVHVPEAGDHVFSGGVDYFPVFRDSYVMLGSYLFNPIPGDDDKRIGVERTSRCVYHRDVRENKADARAFRRLRPLWERA